jgi:hypothetical protein
LSNNPTIYWVRGHLWQHVQVLTPVEAKSQEEAIKLFREATATARDVVVEGVSTDPEELIGAEFGDDINSTEEDLPPAKRIIN